jgi:hypothetical protein
MEPTVLEMTRRTRRHMLTSLVGIGLGFLTMVVGGRLAHDLAPPSLTGVATAVVAALGLAMIPVIGLTSTFRNLRCPACNGFVAMQVSAKFSAFGGLASNNCRHCAAPLFAPGATRRFFVVVIAAVLMLLGALMAFAATGGRHQ